MTDLTTLDVATLQTALQKGEASAVEVTRSYLDRITEEDPRLGAYLYLDSENAVRAATAVDEARARGEELGPLAGVPLALKDVVVTEGVPTTSGSKILEGWTPPYDATVAS